MKIDTNEYFETLWEIYSSKESTLYIKYRQIRELLERLCKAFMQNESLQMTDLAARINFLASKYEFEMSEQNRLHALRLRSNDILNNRAEPTQEMFLKDLKTLAFIVRKLGKKDMPLTLYRVLPKQDLVVSVNKPSEKNSIKKMRVCYQYADETFLYVFPIDNISENLLKVRYNVAGVNDLFTPIIEHLWQHAQVNLLDVTLEDENIYLPEFIVLEPDYLLDISSLAECFKDYGSHPANYHLNKLTPIANARPLLLGNIANLFLDEWIHADQEIDYLECMQKAFKSYPIEIAACEDLQDREKEIQFFKDCKMHFEHIRETVNETFHAPGYNLNKEDAVLEPSYICEALGIQGRLDYMQRNMESFIEMKSGKADEYAIRGKVEPKENNRIQMLLYMAVLEYNMGKDHRKQHPYLFYTRYPLLYPARASWSLVKKAIQLRNRIIADEYGVQLHNNLDYTANKLSEINAANLNEKHLSGRFWEQYLKPSIHSFKDNYIKMSSLEQKYYLALYNFITKEQYTSKSGDIAYEGRSGTASLWLSTLAEKQEAGEILYDLKITDNHAADSHKAYVDLSIPEYEDDFLPNFRAGDIVVLYERNNPEDKVTNKLVLKGGIENITANKIKIRIRAPQHNTSVLPPESLYAVEHDVMDTAYRNMYQGLYNFLTANKDRKELLLSQRQPDFDLSYKDQIDRATNDFERIALKALAAKDYFLLIGPPGTGKTSRALKRMVEKFHTQGSKILLLAYTNRAVDEICKALLSIEPRVDFIRIGSELSCDIPFREYLIENVLSGCNRRSEVHNRISHSQIFVGTVASIANKPELFRLQTFDVAIVDEATQILEPQLIGILCAKGKNGKNALGKFILIGDHKQLPAVVLQSDNQSRICDPDLNSIGITNLKDSLFERIYRFHKKDQHPLPIDMLCRQGRMNPEVANFPNHAFYEGKLESIGLPHQTEQLVCPEAYKKDRELMTRRVSFIPSNPQKEGYSSKTNLQEAQIVANLSARIYQWHQKKFDADTTLGIITPYRSQIALIKKELAKLNIPDLNNILVDTVERFQGSERDIIIYSFSVNYRWQLISLTNIIEENGMLIDRKLNVALTRARKQLFITGAPKILEQNPTYADLLKLIEWHKNFTDLSTS